MARVHGRIYDPHLARFLQADPFIEDRTTLNRYTYVHNSPLVYTDPSGYFSVGQFLRTALAIAVSVYSGGTAANLAWGFYGGVAGAVGPMTATLWVVGGGAVAGAINSGTVEGAAWGAFSAAVFFGIGNGIGNMNWSKGNFLGSGISGAQFAAKGISHGLAGGMLSKLQGGRFGHGFVAAGGSAVTAPFTDPGLKGAALATVVGGTLSSVSGGKFANGAMTAAMSYAIGAAADGLSRGENEAFVPREGNTATGRFGLFPEYAGDPVYEAVYELGVAGNRRSANGREHHSFGGVDADGKLIFQPLQRGREARITTSLLTKMAGEFNEAYPGGSIQHSFHTHGNDVGHPGAFENFSPSDRSFYRRNPIVGQVTGYLATPRGLLLMYNPSTGETTQIGRVPPVPRRPGK